MGFLLDTHTLIWLIEGDNNLSVNASNIIKDKNNDIWVSIISIWEIAIKRNIGKLNLAMPTNDILVELQRINISILPMEAKAVLKVEGLPLHHRDPFDRLLIAQALVDDLTIITRDEKFDVYGAKILW